MLNVRLVSALALAGVFVLNSSAQFADSVVAYTPGSGVASGYNDPGHALGSPTVDIGYQNSDPFNPPFLGSDVVSVGSGGSLTVHLSTPILNTPHAYGIDFMIFGNSGFIITNNDYSGGGITDGSLFANNAGSTAVWVSADNINYYRLNPALAHTVDDLFPTDSAGDFLKAVNPALTGGDFAGADLAGIRSLYNGSGGGAGYDIAWAQDALGNPVSLSAVSYVRVDVLSGKSEIDAFSVVPEPAATALMLFGLSLLHFRRGKRA